jgi:large subunit ribosomal protein L7/L12
MAIAAQDFIKQIDEMSVLDLNNLVKALEEHYGVSAAAAAAPVAAAGAQCGGSGRADQSRHLTEAGANKINATKAVREVPAPGLKGRDLVEGAPEGEKGLKAEARPSRKARDAGARSRSAGAAPLAAMPSTWRAVARRGRNRTCFRAALPPGSPVSLRVV